MALYNIKCSLTHKFSNRTLCCGQTPNIFRTIFSLRGFLQFIAQKCNEISIIQINLHYSLLTPTTYLISWPNTNAVPDEGAVEPVKILKSVVLPAPLCPNMAVICPSYIVKLIPETEQFDRTVRHRLLSTRSFSRQNISISYHSTRELSFYQTSTNRFCANRRFRYRFSPSNCSAPVRYFRRHVQARL